ncbi:GAF domain-containing protein [Kitasatospora aureofaciens]|uniref:GAF domain-containing protein n=1 Tax=Kitasatospora aureofaciens TaxID=1894 RepID=UPI0033DB03B0
MSAAENPPTMPDLPDGSAAPGGGGLRFPDPARLELDQAVQHLLATAHEVQRTQGRIRALLHAVLNVTDQSDLPQVLHHLAASARELTGAAWAAVVPSTEHGRHDIVVHAGLDDGKPERITEELGAFQPLLAERGTVRLDDMRHFPTGPVGISALLGAAVRPAGGGVAELYLADKHHPGHSPGPFTAEDEELVRVLASAAATAIDHAVLLERTRLRETWQHAHTRITTAVLGDADGEHALQVIAEQALLVADADTAAVALPGTPPDRLVVRAAAGLGATALLGRSLPLDASLSGRAYTTGEPQITDDTRTDDGIRAPRDGEVASLGPAVVVPLTDRDQPIGTLSVARTASRRFEPTEIDLLTGFATQAALVHRFTTRRSDDEQLRLLKDRERIGTELRERTVRDLYSIGLDLHSIAGRLASDHRQDVLDAAGRIDDVIKDITATVFDLKVTPEA